MAKKVEKIVKLQIPAGKATPAPPVGPAPGSSGCEYHGLHKELTPRTVDQAGLIIPVVISVYEDRSFIHLRYKNTTGCSIVEKSCEDRKRFW